MPAASRLFSAVLALGTETRRPVAACCTDRGMLQEGAADLVMLARTMLANPHWPLVAARELGLPNPASVLPDSDANWLSRYHFA